jgi:glucokinase
VRTGAFSRQGKLLKVKEAELENGAGPEAGMRRIIGLIEDTLSSASSETGAALELLGIGVGATGPTDSQRGVLINPLTLPGWIDVPIVERLQKHFQVPAGLENDADAAALGEYWAGAGKGVRRLYAVTVGTGVGTAFILDGQVYRGMGGYHPEGGHQIVDPSGPACYCGGNGCLESLCSGTAIGKAAQQALLNRLREVGSIRPGEAGSLLLVPVAGRIEDVTAVHTAEAARKGDALACQVMEKAGGAFALGIFNILMLFHPEMIVLSGGVMRSIDLFMPAIERVIAAASRYIPAREVSVLPAQLGYFAGIYGAAYAILSQFEAGKKLI